MVIATSTLPQDDAIASTFLEEPVFRGSETDVLDRYMGAAIASEADVIIRITGDCPFIDPNVIGEVVRMRQVTGAAYASNIDPPTWPDGLDCEVFTRDALEHAHRYATRPIDRDTVTQFITRNRGRFRNRCVIANLPGLTRERWVLDTGADYEFCKALADRLVHPGRSFLDILGVLDREPWLRDINQSGVRNERFFASLASEEVYHRA